ncbi:MAG: hypothetical protein GY792_05575 [Gammaproteobacteria bacterium]|nr:hypothetical protein [Gammaproteobacteria bacterium]
MSQVQSFRVVAGSAVGSGASGWSVRSSRRSFSGSVVCAVFASWSAAAAFGRIWAGRVGIGCAVRRSGAGWSVSVPVVYRG